MAFRNLPAAGSSGNEYVRGLVSSGFGMSRSSAFDRDGPPIGVDAEDVVHLPHVDEDAAAVRDRTSAPSGAAAARRDLQQAFVAQLDDAGHLFGRLREGHEVGIQAPLQERDLREGREVVAVHHALDFRARNALRPEGVHESELRIIEARHAAFSGGTRADKASVGLKVTRLYGW